MLIMPLVPVLGLSQFDPEYLTADLKKAKGWGFDEEGLVADGKRIRKELYCFPEHLVESVMKHLHEATHCGRDSLTTYVKLWLTGPGISRAIRKVIARCVVCRKNNLKTEPHQRRERKQHQGQCPLEDWQIDFTQMPRV